jgi:soluble lytic murein transglycosylase-like protein
VTTPAATPAPQPPQAFDLSRAVADASGKHYIDPDLIQSIIRQESGGKVHARSNKGAQGLMQLMPGTAAKLGVKDAYDGNANVDAGTRYFRDLLDRYNGDMIKALAAYNAGPHRVDQYKGVPPYSETRRYVAAIVHDFNRKKLAQMTPQQRAAALAKSAAKATSGNSAKNSTSKKTVASAAPASSVGGVQ